MELEERKHEHQRQLDLQKLAREAELARQRAESQGGSLASAEK